MSSVVALDNSDFPPPVSNLSSSPLPPWDPPYPCVRTQVSGSATISGYQPNSLSPSTPPREPAIQPHHHPCPPQLYTPPSSSLSCPTKNHLWNADRFCPWACAHALCYYSTAVYVGAAHRSTFQCRRGTPRWYRRHDRSSFRLALGLGLRRAFVS